MKAKIDLEKFISSMLGYAEDNCEETMLDYLRSALQDQDLEYKDGEIVEIEQEDLRKRYERIGKSDWFKKTHEGMSITIPDNLKGTDMDGGVVGEQGEQGETPFKEHIENLKKRIEDNQLGCIVQRLDKIIELLQSAILVLPKEPYVPPIIYKRPLDPDPNVPGGWTTTASTFGSDYDIDTNKIK